MTIFFTDIIKLYMKQKNVNKKVEQITYYKTKKTSNLVTKYNITTKKYFLGHTIEVANINSQCHMIR